MLSEKDFLNHIHRLSGQSGYFLKAEKSSLFALRNPYGQEVGRVYWQISELPLQTKQEAPNLILANENWLELWQNGKMIAQTEWENSKKLDLAMGKFLSLPQQIQETKDKAFSQTLRQLSSGWLEKIRQNPPQSIPFHQATDRLLEYVRKYLNPQANRRDIWLLGIQHFCFHQFLSQLSSASNFFSSDWVAEQFGEISRPLSKNLFSPDWETLGWVKEIQSYLGNAQSEEGKIQICREACHNLQKAFKFKYQITDNQIFEYSYLNSFIGKNQAVLQLTDSGNWAGDSSQYCSLLSDYYLAKLQGKQAFWLYALHGGTAQNTYAYTALFAGNALESAILESQKQPYTCLLADWRSLNKEAFERGYQKIQEEVNTPKNLQAHPKADWVFWLTQRLEIGGNLLLIAKSKLAFSQKYLPIRKWLEAQFEEVEICQIPDSEAIALMLKGKTDFSSTVVEQAESYAQNKAVSLSRLGNAQSEEEKTNLGNAHADYWLANEPYLDFMPLYPLDESAISVFILNRNSSGSFNRSRQLPAVVKQQTCDSKFPISISDEYCQDKKAVQLPYGLYAGWAKMADDVAVLQEKSAEQEGEIIPFWNTISSDAVGFFRKNHAQELGFTQSVEAKLLRDNLQEIIKFSKQLPVLHKHSLRIFELLPKNKTVELSIQKAEAVLAEIEIYQLKISQLSKGANERKSIFERMQSLLEGMKQHLETAQQQDAWVREQLELVSAENIFHYVYAVLFHVAYWQNFQHLIQLADFPMRVPLLPNFWEFASAGKELANCHLGGKSQGKTASPLVLHEPATGQTTKTVKLRLDKKEGKLWADDFLLISEIPQEALGFQHLGERVLNKQFLVLRNEEMTLEELVEKFVFWVNICLDSHLIMSELKDF